MPNPIDNEPLDESGFVLNCRGHILDCSPGNKNGAHVAGILNVTPDSFYDGGEFLDHGVAMRRAEQIVVEGAAIIDIGGASSRPRGVAYGEGAAPVSPDEEWRRIGLIIKGIIRDLPDTLVSVDTFHGSVADRALEAGAHIINDITALRRSPEIADLVAQARAGLILMHSIDSGLPGGTPITQEHRYDDVVADVRGALRESMDQATRVGVRSIILDPGFGFGKSQQDNLRLLAATPDFVALGAPVMVGVSRKSTIGSVLAKFRNAGDSSVPTSDRLYGTLGATAVGVLRGAGVVRTHDVRETVEMLQLIGATTASNRE